MVKMNKKTGCLICGKDLIYYDNEKSFKCFYCGKTVESNVTCINNHFVCDSCHSLSGNELIFKTCINSKVKDPLNLAFKLMKSPKIMMHGPEHHFLVPAVLITAYFNNLGKTKNKEVTLIKARKRSEKILGGFCGTHGVCGAAVGTGIFISIITNANPLSEKEWKLSNQITAKSLEKIAYYGGPRCCKRNTILAIIGAVSFVKEKLNLEIPIDKNILCDFSDLNKECIKEKCPFYPF
jgi:hypothetical protein